MVGASTPRAFMAASMDSASETADRAVDLAKAGATGWAKVCMRIGEGGEFFFLHRPHSARAGAALSHPQLPILQKRGSPRVQAPACWVLVGGRYACARGRHPTFPLTPRTRRPPCAQFLSPHPFFFLSRLRLRLTCCQTRRPPSP